MGLQLTMDESGRKRVVGSPENQAWRRERVAAAAARIRKGREEMKVLLLPDLSPMKDDHEKAT